jgi:hypothetical protein
MAETLGSLVDKLSIKNLRIWHIDEALESDETPEEKKEELRAKKKLASKQSQELMEEINQFIALALEGKVKIRDQKLKMYQNHAAKEVGEIKKLGKAVSELASRNIRLWHLEDEVRRTDIPDSEVVACKRKIDGTNQERNDFMDKVDEILESHSKNVKTLN